MNQQVTHAYQLRLDIRLWHRLNRYVRARGGYPDARALIIAALEEKLVALEARGPTFGMAWEASHSGLPHQLHDKAAAYRCGALQYPSDGHGQIFSRELLEHFYAERWDERTARLIESQVAECHKRGFKLAHADIDPPTFGMRAPVAHKQTRVTPSADDEII